VGGKELPRRHRRKTTKEEVVRDHSISLAFEHQPFWSNSHYYGFFETNVHSTKNVPNLNVFCIRLQMCQTKHSKNIKSNEEKKILENKTIRRKSSELENWSVTQN